VADSFEPLRLGTELRALVIIQRARLVKIQRAATALEPFISENPD